MNNLKRMINMVDPAHSFIINNEIGLIGKHINEIDNTNNMIGTVKECEVYTCLNSFNNLDDFKRGDYFNVLNKNGERLFEYDIDGVYILISNPNDNESRIQLDYYLFSLKDYKSPDAFDTVCNILNDGVQCINKGYILYNAKTGELMANKLIHKESGIEEINTNIKRLNCMDEFGPNSAVFDKKIYNAWKKQQISNYTYIGIYKHDEK